MEAPTTAEPTAMETPLPAILDPMQTSNPVATTALCIIRPYTLADAPASARLANDPEVAKYLSDSFPHPYTLADAESWIRMSTAAAARPMRDYAICRASDGAFAGGIGFKTGHDVFSRTFELGYWLGRENWGSGMMTEAAVAMWLGNSGQTIAHWAFRTFPDLRRIEAGAYETNEGSIRVLQKAGFKYEGTRRKAAFKNGVSLDVLQFGLLREDLLPANPEPTPQADGGYGPAVLQAV